MRQLVLDTETTGLDPKQGHRVIEVGVVELIDRRLTGKTFHVYLNPDRAIDSGALAVHGISNAFLADKPRFPEIVDDFVAFIGDAELIIHNAPFDMGFLTHELRLLTRKELVKQAGAWSVIDTLAMARRLHPGQKNNLDALCKRYSVDNTDRNLHGALLDAKILALVYLAMTGGQGVLFEDATNTNPATQTAARQPVVLQAQRDALKVIKATPEELQAHQVRLTAIDKAAENGCLWMGNEKH
jgi:DNA polymerase III subunit epsilon